MQTLPQRANVEGKGIEAAPRPPPPATLHCRPPPLSSASWHGMASDLISGSHQKGPSTLLRTVDIR